MGPSVAQLSAQLRQIIWYHLDNDLLNNALFHAGRLQGIDSRLPDNIHILALCHYRNGQLRAAYDCTRVAAFRSVHIGCSYVFALACLGLEKFTEGIGALERSRALWDGSGNQGKVLDASRRHTPDAASVQCLLGKLAHGNGDLQRAVECYVEALKLNPFMWDAFERLCDTGANIRPSNIFKPNPNLEEFLASLDKAQRLDQYEATSSAALNSNTSTSFQNIVSPSSDPFNPPKNSADLGLNHGKLNLLSKLNKGNVPRSTAEDAELTDLPAPGSARDFISGPSHAARAPSIISNDAPEPPNAPLRRKTQNTSFDMSSGADTAQLRGVPRRDWLKEFAESAEPGDTQRANWLPSQPGKRSISGAQPPNTFQTSSDSTTAPQRRSVRLFKKTPSTGPQYGGRDQADLKKAKATGTRGRSAAAAASTVGRVVSGNRKPMPSNSQMHDLFKDQAAIGAARNEPESRAPKIQPLDETARDMEAAYAILDLLKRIANGHFALNRYQTQQALQSFQSLPVSHRDTPWVQAQLGKALFEQADYAEAAKYFSRIRKLCPSHMQAMEIYSTLLWHTKADADLAFLAHELADQDRLSPEAWCSVGNSFSLARDHDQALRCFKRATQLSPRFAYGYTLQGHEHVSNEEYDKALLAYRRAVAADQRHYNGWYGLGKVYEKLGKYDMAEKHYRFAVNINPNNAILVCYIGTVLDKQGKHLSALAQYDHAVSLAPSSAMARFKRARALLRLRRNREALAEFELLKDMAPDEANVHFMLGKVHKMRGDKTGAIRHLLVALNLDPKASPLIKEAMDGLDDDDDIVDDDEGMAQ